jgi:pyroglutamyl-peptidase
MNSSRLLITGFEPFDGHDINVSWSLAQALPNRAGPGDLWVAGRLPCAFGAASAALLDLIERHRPDTVIALGQAEGRAEITIERVAINIRDARIADNHGARPVDEPIIEGAPLAYPSSLPYRQLVNQLRAKGHPVAISNTAGTFVCNEVFFSLQHHLRGRPIRSGFVHLPILPEQQSSPRAAIARVAREDAPIAPDRVCPTLSLETQLNTLVDLIRLMAEP